MSAAKPATQAKGNGPPGRHRPLAGAEPAPIMGLR